MWGCGGLDKGIGDVYRFIVMFIYWDMDGYGMQIIDVYWIGLMMWRMENSDLED